jgi:hypothetical protein
MSLIPVYAPIEAAPVTIEFTDSAVSGSNLTTYTFSSVDIGSAETGRRIVVVTQGREVNPAVSSITINSVSAALVYADHLDGGSSWPIEIWSAVVPTGTSVTISLVFTLGCAAAGIGVFKVMNAAATASATVGNNATGTSKATATIDVPAHGGVISYAACFGGSSTWTLASVTEGFDETVEGADTHAGGQNTYATAQSSLDVGATPSGSSSYHSVVAAAWGRA